MSICNQYAKEKGIEIESIYKDLAVSGRLNSRTEFDSMIQNLKIENKNEVKIDYVIMSEYSRFSRNLSLGVTEDMEQEIKKTGCHLIFEKGNLSTENANDDFAIDMEKLKAKHESVEF